MMTQSAVLQRRATGSVDGALEFSHAPHHAPTSDAACAALIEAPRFGSVFTDHMVTIDWTAEDGWHDAQVRAHASFALAPASAVLHYSQTIFEGLKAYPAPDGGLLLFRPEENARRFNASAARLAMPPLPEQVFVAAIEQLVRVDARWMPRGEGTLYLRPFIFANETFLGVRPAQRYTFCVIASPTGAFFKGKGGAQPITVWISDQYSRAGEGGTGAAKCGGNYAASLAAQAEASLHGCDQVVFLDAAEHRWIEELGGMNIFFVMADGSLKTPPLGTILPGITRASIIELARAAGMRVEEARYDVDEWRRDALARRLREVFVCGTAATVAAIGKVCGRDGKFVIGDGTEGPTTAELRRTLLGIQRGLAPDPFGWRRPVLPGRVACRHQA